MKILGKIGFYCVIFFFSFLLFLYFMLPTDILKQRVIAMAAPILGADTELEIAELDTYHLTGLTMEGVVLSKKIEGKKIPLVEIDALTVHAGFFSLLFGNPQVAFDVEAGDFEADGSVENREDRWLITLRFEELDLGIFPYLSKKTGVKLFSEIDGELQLDYNPKEPLNPQGELQLTFHQLGIKKGKSTLGGEELELPNLFIASKNSMLKAILERGYLKIEALKLAGKDLSVEVEGLIFMARTLDKYRFKLEGGLEIPKETWKVIGEVAAAVGKGGVMRQMGVDANTASIVVRDGVTLFKEKLDQEKRTGIPYPIKVAGFLLAPQVYSGETKLWPFDINTFMK